MPDPIIDLDGIIAGSLRLRPATKVMYRRAVRDWLAFAGHNPAGWTGAQAQAFYLLLRTQMQPQSADALMQGLAYVSKRAHKLYGIPDFVDAVEMAKRSDSATKTAALDLMQARALLATCRRNTPADVRDRAILVMGLATGLRQAGLRSIELKGVDIGSVYAFAKVELKGGDSFNVPLAPCVIKAVEDWRGWLTFKKVSKGKLFRSVSIKRINGDVAISSSLSQSGLYKSLEKRAKDVGVADFHPHVLRHTFITWCQIAGMSSIEIASITGHAVGSVIDRVYTDSTKIAPQALIKIEEFMRPVLE